MENGFIDVTSLEEQQEEPPTLNREVQINSIRNERISDSGEHEYLIKWRPVKETWVAAEELKQFPELIQAFEKRKRNAPKYVDDDEEEESLSHSSADSGRRHSGRKRNFSESKICVKNCSMNANLEIYVLHVEDPSDKITTAHSFHCFERRIRRSSNKLMYFTSKAEEAIQEITDHINPDFEPTKRAVTSDNAMDAEKCIRLFSEKEENPISPDCFFVWGLKDIPPPPTGKFVMVQLDLVDEKVYKDRIELLKPSMIYNVCSSSEEAAAWRDMTTNLGYKVICMDFSTEEKWEEYGIEHVIG